MRESCSWIWRLPGTFTSFCVNSVGLTLVALFISLYRWASLRKDFLNHLEMEEKNEMITRQSERLNYLANHDPLTGLWNRNYLSEWTDRFFSENSRRQIAVFVIDIDHFKEYNDTFGHVEGDECLKKGSRRPSGIRRDSLSLRRRRVPLPAGNHR